MSREMKTVGIALAGVGFRARPDEFLTRPRNAAAEMGGTHVVPTSDPYAGRQAFDVYL